MVTAVKRSEEDPGEGVYLCSGKVVGKGGGVFPSGQQCRRVWWVQVREFGDLWVGSTGFNRVQQGRDKAWQGELVLGAKRLDSRLEEQDRAGWAQKETTCLLTGSS